MVSIRQFTRFAVIGLTMILATGCASSDRPKEVPASAHEYGAGKAEATFTAAYDGTVYVVDDNRKEVIYTGKVNRGDYVKVDAKGNQVTINNQKVTDRDLINDHKYKIYFEQAMVPAPEKTSQTTITTDPNAKTTVTTDPNAAQPAKTTVTDPNAKTTVTTDPNSGTTTIKKE